MSYHDVPALFFCRRAGGATALFFGRQNGDEKEEVKEAHNMAYCAGNMVDGNVVVFYRTTESRVTTPVEISTGLKIVRDFKLSPPFWLPGGYTVRNATKKKEAF